MQNPDISWYGLDFNNIDVVTMYGGEPFYMKQSKQLTAELTANPSNKILQYFTNGTILPDDETLSLWKQIKKLILIVSIDGYKEDNDYFRHGSKWDEVESALHYYISEGHKHNWDIRISTLINIYNVDCLDILHNWLINNGINESSVLYNLCIIPQELDIRNLPQEYKNNIIEKYKTINLPEHIKNLVINQLNQQPNISFIASVALSNKLDDIRNQSNPNLELQKYINEY